MREYLLLLKDFFPKKNDFWFNFSLKIFNILFIKWRTVIITGKMLSINRAGMDFSHGWILENIYESDKRMIFRSQKV